MAGEQLGTTIDLAHEAVMNFVRETFPDLQQVTAYGENREEIQMPAFMFELEEFEMGELENDVGTGQISLITRWCGYFIELFNVENVKTVLRSRAGEFAFKIHNNRLGLRCDPCRFIRADPESFKPSLEKFEVFKVEWSQVIILGDVPQEPDLSIYLGFEPNVGLAHKDDYILLGQGVDLP
jgi:hypothetical protein